MQTKKNNQKSKMRFADAELDIIKGTFAENIDLIMAMRKVFFQMELTKTEIAIIKSAFKSKAVLDVVRKTFVPTIDPNAPIGQLIDLHMTIPLKDKDPEDAYPHILVIDLVIDYLNQQMEVFSDIGAVTVATPSIFFNTLALKEDKDVEQRWVTLLARNTITQQVEANLHQLIMLAGLKEETVEQTVDRLQKNSTK